MSDHALTEEFLQFGEGGRLFGVLTLPSMPPRNAPELPVFLFLSAGLLHRVGPYRLHVRLGRELAQMGFSSLRVDLAGTGDSPPRAGLTNQQSVAADFAEILGVLESRLGCTPLVLAGLCSGADNAMRLALNEPRVIGAVLLDPICFPDRGYLARQVVAKYTNPARYIAWLTLRFKAFTRPRRPEQAADADVDPLTLRDYPTREQLRAAFDLIHEREGRVLSIFSFYARGYYNQAGQMGRALGVIGYEQFCTELFWPNVHHTYSLELHRRRLMEVIKTWAGNYVHKETIPKTHSLVSKAVVHIGRHGIKSFVRAIFARGKRIPKIMLRILFNFDDWHTSSFSERPYAQAIVSYLNNRTLRGNVVEIGCGMGDILRRLNYHHRLGLDREKEVLDAAFFISKFYHPANGKLDFKQFDLLRDRLAGTYDVILMVNWIHEIEPDILKRTIEELFNRHLNENGDLIFDVLANRDYKYNHSFEELTSNLNSENIVLGSFVPGRTIISARRSVMTH